MDNIEPEYIHLRHFTDKYKATYVEAYEQESDNKP